jgi:hypothetical protein
VVGGLFDADYVKTWSAMGAFDRTEEQTRAIVELLDLPVGAAVLAVACGFGRIAGPLHHHGFRVTGIDISHTNCSWQPRPTRDLATCLPTCVSHPRTVRRSDQRL